MRILPRLPVRDEAARAKRRQARRAGLVCLLSFLFLPRGFAQWKEDPEKIILDTGMTCLYQKDRSSSLTVVHLVIAGGKAAVPPAKDGLAHLTTRLALEIPDMGKAQKLMSQATRMTMTVREDCTVIGIECLSENLEEALRVASAIIQKPLFSAVRIDHIMDVMKIQGRSEDDDSVATGHNAALDAFFGGVGRGGAVYGTEESLRAIKKRDLTAYFNGFFTKAGIFFSVCSDLDRESIRNLLQTHFDGFPEGSSRTDLHPSAPILPDEKIIMKERVTKQSYVGQAFLLPPLSSSNYAKGFLLEVLLGRAPGCRLWNLRARERLAYNVNAKVTWTKDGGLLEAYLETENGKRDRALSGLEGVIGELYEHGVDEEELETNKILARAWFLRAQEGKEARAGAMGQFESLGLGLGFLTDILDEIMAVEPESMNRFIRDVLGPDRSVVVIVGPGEQTGTRSAKEVPK